jgi:hypothetical protein
LEVYLRAPQHFACVSFVEEADANEFFQHIKRNGIYILGQNVCNLRK